MMEIKRREFLVGATLAATTSRILAATGRTAPAPFFPDLVRLDIKARGVRFHGVTGGSGPPLLLLHGYPETHIAWRKVAPALYRNYRLVIPSTHR